MKKLGGMKILVTGGAGYLGSVITEHMLKNGDQVTVIDNLMYRQHSLFHLCDNSRFKFVLGDVRDEPLMRDLVKEADVIVPLAAIVGVPACDRDPVLARSVNLDAIRFLNRLRSSYQLVIFPSTESGYGNKLGGVCTEDTLLEPISHYARTKVQAERELLDSSNAVTLRLATVYGMSPRMRLDLLVNHFVHEAVTNDCIIIYERGLKRNTIHIRDVADCFVYCMEHANKMEGQSYNVGRDDASLSKEELALKIKKYVPTLHIHFLTEGSDPDKRNYSVSNQRLREKGFGARRSLDDGIKELLNGYRMMARSHFTNA